MRPRSIITFERLYLAGIALSILNFMLFSGYMDGTAKGAEGLSTTPLVTGFAIGIAIYLLLWFLIAHRASVIAKWAAVVVFLLGLAQLPPILAAPFSFTNLLALVAMVLQLAAVTFLFRKDAEAWLGGPDDPDMAD